MASLLLPPGVSSGKDVSDGSVTSGLSTGDRLARRSDEHVVSAADDDDAAVVVDAASSGCSWSPSTSASGFRCVRQTHPFTGDDIRAQFPATSSTTTTLPSRICRSVRRASTVAELRTTAPGRLRCLRGMPICRNFEARLFHPFSSSTARYQRPMPSQPTTMGLRSSSSSMHTRPRRKTSTVTATSCTSSASTSPRACSSSTSTPMRCAAPRTDAMWSPTEKLTHIPGRHPSSPQPVQRASAPPAVRRMEGPGSSAADAGVSRPSIAEARAVAAADSSSSAPWLSSSPGIESDEPKSNAALYSVCDRFFGRLSDASAAEGAAAEAEGALTAAAAVQAVAEAGGAGAGTPLKRAKKVLVVEVREGSEAVEPENGRASSALPTRSGRGIRASSSSIDRRSLCTLVTNEVQIL
eukprot:Rhum_TRINITY_DN14656_c6_g1::Rhum_TRINITY_DN14656_c6_g1_i1::g.107952::m.107952